jgi:nucleoside phosphorylase
MASAPSRSLYLYFLDRELADATGYRLDPVTARAVIRTLVTGTGSRLYCGLSLLYENDALDVDDVRFLTTLVQLGALDLASHQQSFEEFLAARQDLYRHDAGRYPAYFGQRTLPAIQPTVLKSGGTTSRLATGLRNWAEGVDIVHIPTVNMRRAALRVPTLTALDRREDRAITYALFRSHLGNLAREPLAERLVRRAISQLFAMDYRDFADGDVPTGLRGLQVFERQLSLEFPLHDARLIAELVRLAGVGALLRDDIEVHAEANYLNARHTDPHVLFVAALSWILYACRMAFVQGSTAVDHDTVRFRILDLLRLSVRARPEIDVYRLPPADGFVAAAANAERIGRLLMRVPALGAVLEETRPLFFPPPRADVVLVVATDIEYDSVVKVFDANGYPVRRTEFSDVNIYEMFGAIAGADIALLRCSMGAGGPGGAALTVAEAIDHLHPTSVIMAGIAFGIDPTQQSIGQVLVSTRVFDYELRREGTDVAGRLLSVDRGARPEASPRLLSRFRGAHLAAYEIASTEGLLLSGDKLVDNVDYRDQLTALAPDAIGGEMEGFGVYSAAARRNVDWVVVKAICDWADGRKRVRKKARQNDAASRSAEAVLRTLERGGFVPRG